MATTIFIGSFTGYKLDLYFKTENSIFTTVLSLFSIAIALVYVLQQTKEKEK
jgi:hypothetical protein